MIVVVKILSTSIMGTKGALGVAFFTCLVLAYGYDRIHYTCPPDDVPGACKKPGFGGGCVEYVDKRKNFKKAKAHCRRKGLQLVEIRSKERHRKLQKAVKSLPYDTMVYIGANDFRRNRRFVWNSDGTDVNFPKSWWQRYEPNNFHTEDCLAMKHSGLINDVRCRKKLTFFCEPRA